MPVIVINAAGSHSFGVVALGYQKLVTADIIMI